MNIEGTSTAFDKQAYQRNNALALRWFKGMMSQFGLIPLTGYDDEQQTLMIEIYKAGDILFYDRHYPRIFRSAELEVRNRNWDTGHWTLGSTVHCLGRKLDSPAAVYVQFSTDGTHAVCARVQDRRSGTEVVANVRGEEHMGDINTYNCLFLVKTEHGWAECPECSSKWHDEDGSTKAQRSLRRMLRITKHGRKQSHRRPKPTVQSLLERDNPSNAGAAHQESGD